MGQKILRDLIVAVRNHLCRSLHVALLCLHQTAQILLRSAHHVMIAGSKKIFEVLTEPPPVGRSKLFERLVMVNPVFAITFR